VALAGDGGLAALVNGGGVQTAAAVDAGEKGKTWRRSVDGVCLDVGSITTYR
jgi:hypothetical protein